MIPAYNLSHGSLDLLLEEFFTRPPCSSLRGHYLKLRHGHFRLNRRKAAFSVRIVGPWNRVPAFVVESPSAGVFKSRLDARCSDVFRDVIKSSMTQFRDNICLLNGFFLRYPHSTTNNVELTCCCCLRHSSLTRYSRLPTGSFLGIR